MKTPKVRLYLRVRLPQGRNAFVDPAWNRNRTLRAGYAVIEGSAQHHPEGSYYLRFLKDGKRTWQPVGTDADAAVVALRNVEHDLQSIVLGRPTSPIFAESEQPAVTLLSLDGAIQSYLQEVKQFRAPRTIAACEQMLNLFSSRLRGRSLVGITRKDLLTTWRPSS
jgi:integrase/recombinase XerD